MGDRCNVVVRQGQGTNRQDVWFYLHWGGADYVDLTQKALARKVRWTDPTYLARIVFDALTEGAQGSETGAGIGTCLVDNDHDILVVDVPAQEVYFVTEESLQGSLHIWNNPEKLRCRTFNEFVGEPAFH